MCNKCMDMKQIKFIDIKQLEDIHKYKNIKQKLLKTNTAIKSNMTHISPIL
jgi:hypothetical protein